MYDENISFGKVYLTTSGCCIPKANTSIMQTYLYSIYSSMQPYTYILQTCCPQSRSTCRWIWYVPSWLPAQLIFILVHFIKRKVQKTKHNNQYIYVIFILNIGSIFCILIRYQCWRTPKELDNNKGTCVSAAHETNFVLIYKIERRYQHNIE